MDLKFVVAVRHGQYFGGSLNDQGKEDVTKLTAAIVTKVAGINSIVLLTSPLLRAVETAQIIGVGLNTTHQCVNLLQLDFYECYRDKEAKELLELAENCECVVAVSHNEAPSAILNIFSEKYLQKTVWCQTTRKGCGLCLCLESGEICPLP
jgi:phosphohistidine phosphatase SixA